MAVCLFVNTAFPQIFNFPMNIKPICEAVVWSIFIVCCTYYCTSK